MEALAKWFTGLINLNIIYINMADNEEEVVESGEEVDFSKESDMDTEDDLGGEDGEPNMELSNKEIE